MRPWNWCVGGLLAVVLAACAPAQPAASPKPVAPLQAAVSSLAIGTSGDYAPFSSRDGAGVLSGFDIELAEQLGRDLGREIRWVTFRWPTLREQLSRGEFDVVMSGVTWQPARAVLGRMTRAVAWGGPCVLGAPAEGLIGVNRGGMLEAWARGHFAGRELLVVDDNRSLPDLLGRGAVSAIVTDSFELRSFQRPGVAASCEPALARKVYWVAPARADELLPQIDAWLRGNTARIEAAQARWFGARQPLSARAHLLDLLARRMAFMPLVAGLKARRGLPIEDQERERELLARVSAGARRRDLPEPAVRALFEAQLSLSKAVQRRMVEASELDLAGQIRPALDRLGEQILDALVEARAGAQLAELGSDKLEVLSPWLTPAERLELAERLSAVAAH